MDRSDLHAYQRSAIGFLKENRRAALFLEMGLGKTVIALTLIDDLMTCGEIRNALVIAPRRLLVSTWIPEAEKWDHLFLRGMTLIEGKTEDRAGAVGDGRGVFAVSVDSVWNYDDLQKTPWDLVVVDESIRIKNPDSRRFKGVRRLTKEPGARAVVMSGIPAPNSEMDLWSQYHVLDRGIRLEPRIGRFRSRFFYYEEKTRRYRAKPGARRKISSLVKDISLGLSAKDYLEMPDRFTVDLPVDLPEECLADYRSIEEDFLLELEKETLEIVDAGAKLQKAMQFCSGFVYGPDGMAERRHPLKADLLAEVMEGNPGENLLVAYRYREDLRYLKERFPEGAEVTPETVEAWNRGELSLMFLHPQASGYGLNLQAGGSVVFWYSLTWSYSDYEQTNARVWRQGQERPVRIIRPVCRDTVEERIARALEHKGNINLSVMEHLKAEMRYG